MAHELRADVEQFAALEHLDAGAPKTTDLDDDGGEAPGEGAQEEVSASREQSGLDRGQEVRATTTTTLTRSTKMDQEDVITVKYLPLGPRQAQDQGRDDGLGVSR